MDEHNVNEMRALISMAHKDGLDPAEVLHSVGYRKDPYPNGNSKAELIDSIERIQRDLDKARVFLRKQHKNHVVGMYAITMERHRALRPDCEICLFLDETSTVKS